MRKYYFSFGFIGLSLVQGFSVLLTILLITAAYSRVILVRIERSMLATFRHEEVRIACAESMLAHVIRNDPLPESFEKTVYGHMCRRVSIAHEGEHIRIVTETEVVGVVTRMVTTYSSLDRKILELKNV